MNMTSLHPCSVGLRCWGAGLAFMLEPRRGVSGPTFAFAVGSFLMGGSDDGTSPVDVTPSPVLGGQYTSELAGGRAFTHQETSMVVAPGWYIYAIS